jgi:putative phosphonate metabolism protein
MMSEALAHRYAVYFAPAVDNEWWQAGSRWLGRDAESGELLAQPAVSGVSAQEQQRWTKAPRRYGWHATLKAPFALAPGVDLQVLRDALRRLCEAHEPFAMPPLKTTRLDDFLALVPDGDSRAIRAIADACVMRLQALAAPLSSAELQRRRTSGLTPEEDALLLHWGYPFVLDRFRFHLSLTGALRDAEASTVEALRRAAAECFGALPACRFDAISLFAEPAPGADFVLVEQMRLGA